MVFMNVTGKGTNQMKNLIAFLMILALGACKAEDIQDTSRSGDETKIEDEQDPLEPFIAEFEKEAKADGVEFDAVPTYLTGDFDDRTHVRLGGLARCVYEVNENGSDNYVEIYREIWEGLTPYQKRKVFFHMQGKCRYNLADTGSGIMRNNVEGEGALSSDWDALLDEYFDAVITAGF
jgi:hypothetical protein